MNSKRDGGIDFNNKDTDIRGDAIGRDKNTVNIQIFSEVGRDVAALLGKAWGQRSESADFAAAQARYEQKIIELYGSMRVFGQMEPRPLDDIFTDVYILPKPTLFRRFQIESLHEQFLTLERDMPLRYRERQAGDALIKTVSKLLILGKPGAGKTTFCKHLAVREAKRLESGVGKVPIFVTLKQFADTGMSLIDFINEQFAVCSFPAAEPFVTALLESGKALVLFDGLDEVTKDAGGRNRVATEINHFSQKYSRCHIVVTCRIAANHYSFEQFRYVEMADFAPDQVATFVRQWFKEEGEHDKGEKMLNELRQHDGIKDLTRNPLLLTLLCLNYDETMAFPTRRVEIYQDALEALLKKWDSSRGIQRGSAYGSLSVGRKQEMLAEIAYETYKEGRYFIERREIEPMLVQYVAGAPEVPAAIDLDGEVILNEIIAQHGMLAYRATDIVSFSHKTFHEYFTAKQIVENREMGTFAELIKHAAEDSWKEVFLLAASLLHKGSVKHFFSLFLQTLQRTLDASPNASRWLAHIAATTARNESGYRAPAIRAYFALAAVRAHAIALAYDLVYVLDIALVYNHNLDHYHYEDRARARAIVDKHTDDLNQIRSLVYALDHEQLHDRDLDLALDLATDLAQELMLDELHFESGQVVAASSLQPSILEWRALRRALKEVIKTHRTQMQPHQLQTRTLHDDCILAYSDVKTLTAFMRGSIRLYNCLQVAYLRPKERRAFEDQLLLPSSPPTN